MRILIVHFCLYLMFISSGIYGQTYNRLGYEYPKTEQEILANSMLKWSANNFNAQTRLQEIKFHIINGNLEVAKVLISQTSLSVTFTEKIKNRYLALIHFIEGNYEEVIKVLNRPNMNVFTEQAKFCFIKILSLIITEKPNIAKNEWRTCRQASLPHSPSDLLWMETIVQLKTTSDDNFIKSYFDKINIDDYSGEFLRIYLKLALYLNQQEKIIPRFKFFGSEPLENEIERELIGLNYYRNGNLYKSYQLLENLSTANSEVFKGNLYLHQKKLEPAYAQFKIALKRKSNSENALERLLPLSWRLAQYKEGISFINRLSESRSISIEQETVKAAFAILSENYELADNSLKKINKLSNLSDPIEVSQIKVVSSLKRKEYLEILDPAISACKGNDGVNCWFIMALTSWESLNERVSSPDLIHEGMDSLIDYYKGDSEVKSIEEEKLIEQKFIEELDNELIRL